YIWTYDQLVGALGEQDAAIFCRRYGVERGGNVHEDPHGEFGGRNILYEAHDLLSRDQRERLPMNPDQPLPAVTAQQVGDEQTVLARAAAKLMQIRSQRPRPHLDDKILAGWNALMISAFAKGAQILDEPRYGEAARAARSFLRAKLW